MNYKDYCDFAEYLKKITPNASVVKANADKAMTLLICGIQFRPEGVGVSLGSDNAACRALGDFIGQDVMDAWLKDSRAILAKSEDIRAISGMLMALIERQFGKEKEKHEQP